MASWIRANVHTNFEIYFDEVYACACMCLYRCTCRQVLVTALAKDWAVDELIPGVHRKLFLKISSKTGVEPNDASLIDFC